MTVSTWSALALAIFLSFAMKTQAAPPVDIHAVDGDAPKEEPRPDDKKDEEKVDPRVDRLKALKHTGAEVRDHYFTRYDSLKDRIKAFQKEVKELKESKEWPQKGKAPMEYPFPELEKAMNAILLNLEVGDDADERKIVKGLSKEDVETDLRKIALVERVTLLDYSAIFAAYAKGMNYRLKEIVKKNGKLTEDDVSDPARVQWLKEQTLTTLPALYRGTTFQTKAVQDIVKASPKSDLIFTRIDQLLHLKEAATPMEPKDAVKHVTGYTTYVNKQYKDNIEDWEKKMKKKE